MPRIQTKRSSVAGDIPLASELIEGELAINIADGILYYLDEAGVVQSISAGAGGGSGITSVGLTMPTGVFDVSDSPLTSDGTIAVTFDNQIANKVFAGPATGSATTPTFRLLTATDIPSITLSQVSDAGSIASQAAASVVITGGSITGMSSPSDSSDVATKGYVDSFAAGMVWKSPVVAATTAAVTLATAFENGDTLDGVTLATGNRILIKDQADGTANGIYTVNASGAPTRATDADAGSELVSAAVFVSGGTVNANKAFICTNTSITLGVTSVVFANFSSSTTGALIATNNLSDVPTKATARTNLGLGTIATQAASAVAITGGTIQGMPIPSNSGMVANKSYVDSVAAGLRDFKDSVKVATTANITLSGTQTIDGVSLSASHRVLVKNQNTASQNGIYTVAAGAWSRSTDADSSAEVTSGAYVYVTEGTTQAGTSWVLATPDPIVLATTSLSFVQFNGVASGSYLAISNNLSDVANAGTARTNLGLGTLATQNGTFTDAVIGPASATDNAVVRFDTTTGKLVQDSAVTIADTSGDITAGKFNKVTVTAPSTGATLTIVDGGSLITAGAYAITLTATNTTGVTLPTTGTLATLAGSETLSSKTLTAPKLADGGFIADANGNEIIVGTTTASAVTYVLVTPGATTVAPSIKAAGETNVSLTLDASGTGVILAKQAFGTEVVALSDGANIATDCSQGNTFRVTLAGNRTLDNPTNPVDGFTYVWELIQDATGSRTITLGNKFAFGTDITAVTLTTTASKRDFVTCKYNSTADKFYVVAFVKGY